MSNPISIIGLEILKCHCGRPATNKKYGLCEIHNWERLNPGKDYFQYQFEKKRAYAEKMLEKQREKPRKIYEFKAKKVAPNPISKKQNQRLSSYAKIASQFKLANPKCQVKGCGNPTSDVHHMKGKIGDLLTDERYFLPVCRVCHTYIEEHPEWAKENGYSLSRLEQDQ